MFLEIVPQKLNIHVEPLSASQMQRKLLAPFARYLVTVYTQEGRVGVAPFETLPEIGEMVSVQKDGRPVRGMCTYLEHHPPVDYKQPITEDRGAPRALLVIDTEVQDG